MGFLTREAGADREQLLEAAGRARSQGRRRRAIGLYRELLARERGNAALHAKLAPLLAETGQEFDAWVHFRETAQAALRAGREDRALAIYDQASKGLPREIQVWQAMARLLVRQGEEVAAVETLLEGSRFFRVPFLRPQAIHLLRRARTIDPWHFEVVLELAGLLRRGDQRPEARWLLEGLASRVTGRRLRRVRAAQLRVDPGARALWRWLRTPEAPPPVCQPVESAAPREVTLLRAVRR